jgi:agmatinase
MNTSLSKQDKILQFNPNNPAQDDANLFGLPFNAEESDIVILPVPWEVTVSYQAGTAKAPMAILEASAQVDLLDSDVPDAWKAGIHLLPQPEELFETSIELRDQAVKHIESLNQTIEDSSHLEESLARINKACAEMVEYVQQETRYWLLKNKIVGLIGGDHSTPLGFIKTLAEFHDSFGILQIDAHCDLRNAYEGFTYSHASIMYNALQVKQVDKLVQVGIRDYCSEEMEYINNSSGRVVCYLDEQLNAAQFAGITWDKQCAEIIAQLPEKVYISFDIDGLNPSLCPNTGTPVPGGLEFHQAIYLLRKLAKSGKTIIGFDLNEVSPGADEWDANVGARLLFKLAVFAGLSQGVLSA